MRSSASCFSESHYRIDSDGFASRKCSSLSWLAFAVLHMLFVPSAISKSSDIPVAFLIQSFDLFAHLISPHIETRSRSTVAAELGFAKLIREVGH